MDYEVEENVVLPRLGYTGGNYKYPWEELAIGDSFFVQNKTINSMASLAYKTAKRLNMKFTCRSVTENEHAGVRVWRIL